MTTEPILSAMEPAGWKHTLHMEQEQTCVQFLGHDGTDDAEPTRTGFGIPGRDYSEEYSVTAEPLYTRDQLIAAMEADRAGRWLPIESAPLNTPVRVKVGSMTFIARLLPDASMSDLETTCDQWQAENEGEHPPCWSGGACWASNEDDMMSLQPTAWQPLPTPPAQDTQP